MHVVVLYLWRAHHVAIKIICVSASGVVHLTHDDIIGKTRDDGVGAGESVCADERDFLGIVELIGEAECHAAVGIKRIELRNGAVDDLGEAAVEAYAVIESIGDLAANDSDDAMVCLYAIALAVVYCAVLDVEFQLVERRGIAYDSVVSGMQVGEAQLVAQRRGIEVQPFPLTADEVVRQIVEHSVETVAAKCHRLLGGTLGDEFAEYVDACVFVEIKCCSRIDDQCGKRVNGDTTIDDYRSFGGESLCTLDMEVADFLRIPRPSVEIDLLRYAAFKVENKVVFHEFWLYLSLHWRGNFHENSQRISLPYLYVVKQIASLCRQELTVHIDAKACLVAVLQLYLAATDAVGGVVVNPERLCWCRNL